MIACTSISPTHINGDIQKKAINSWIELGIKVYSFNCQEEIEKLKENYTNVEFIETRRHMKLTYGKPLVNINAVLDWCKDQKEDEFVLINSDVELMTDKETIERIRVEMQKSIVLENRTDYIETYDYNNHKYIRGIDAFFIHKQWMMNFGQSMHCFGMTFWDYYIPYTAIKKGINVIFLLQKIAFHKAHTIQYNDDQWRKSGRFFLWENNLYQFDHIRQLGEMSEFVFNFIYNGSTRKNV